MSHTNYLRHLPSISDLLNEPTAEPLLTQFGHNQTVTTLRQIIDQYRTELLNTTTTPTLIPNETIITQAATQLNNSFTPSLKQLINGTGVIIHTNLGRAPLSLDAMHASNEIAQNYNTLEYDLNSGERGSRQLHIEAQLNKLLQTEASLIVNNNAAAALLMLTTLANGREIIISRSQLVEIGGGFRIPDLLRQSGATLVEVGTTNRTHLSDYEKAINEQTAAILIVHPSNYKIVGFTSIPSLSELSTLAQKHKILTLYDQGSGCLLDTAQFGLDPEPTVQEGIDAGVDLLCFSGDKLLGGPQAGILIGRSDLIAQIKKAPLMRALRPDKQTLAALGATLNHYLKDEPLKKIPIWQMIAQSASSIEEACLETVSKIPDQFHPYLSIEQSESTVGGGSLPGTSLPSYSITITFPKIDQFAHLLRKRKEPIIGRILAEKLLIDLRTVLPHQKERLIEILTESLEDYLS